MPRVTFDLFGPVVPTSPVVVSVPHAGRDYPDLVGLLRHPVDRLRALEDRHADLLAERAIAGGANAIIARLPRLLIDLNRSEGDLDPAMVVGGLANGPATERMRGGLGLIPRRLAEVGDIWRSMLSGQDVADRVEGHYRPYHDALSAMLERARSRFGVALLIDLHSMPSLVGLDKPTVVLGDRFGTTCAPTMTAGARAVFRKAGFHVGTNAPYAGGHIVSRHADRQANIHALQVEIDRAQYLDGALDRAGPGLPRLQRVIEQLVDTLSAQIIAPSTVAAE